MDQLLYWLDSGNSFGHAWPWAIATAVVAVAALVGIVNVARRYGNPVDALTD